MEEKKRGGDRNAEGGVKRGGRGGARGGARGGHPDGEHREKRPIRDSEDHKDALKKQAKPTLKQEAVLTAQVETKQFHGWGDIQI